MRRTGLALAACEKSVQIIYEHRLRPADKLHAPWLERVTAQLLAAYTELEREWSVDEPTLRADAIQQDALSSAVAWHFTQRLLSDVVDPAGFPALVRLSERAEALPAFRAAPHGDATYPSTVQE